MIKKLILLANRLDKAGLYKEASALDLIIKECGESPLSPEWQEIAEKDREDDPDEPRREIGALNIQLKERQEDLRRLKDYSRELEERLREKNDPGLNELLSELYEKYYA